ncbi:MAG: hypothetical protein ACFCU3_04225 [Verrucomicrobiales bacterium]
MKNALNQIFRRLLGDEKPLHPQERGMVKRYIKERLRKLFPELRGNPEALERAYQELDIDISHEAEPGNEGRTYEMRLPQDIDKRSLSD